MRVLLSKLYTRPWKLEATLRDIHEGRLSFTRTPAIVSRLEHPRGSFFVFDGHHRIIESFLAGQARQEIAVDKHVPRLERTGGAYASYIKDRVNIYEWLRQNVRIE